MTKMIFTATWLMRSKVRKTILMIVVTALWPTVALAGLNEDLCVAAGRGNQPEVKRLLAKGTDINRGVAKGWTAMMFASASGHREAVKELLAKGDEVNAQDNNGSGVQSSPSADDAITIKRLGEVYEVTTPLSRLTLIIPSAGLSQAEEPAGGGATDNPRYFRFLDRNRGLVISGWFEPSEKFVAVRKQWAMDTSNWKRRGLPEPQNPSFSIIGDWDTVTFDQIVGGITQSHIRTHWLRFGTWIDLHLALASDRSTADDLRAVLENLLKRIQVKEKP